MAKWLVKSLLGGVSFAALSCSAFAADMAVKAPPVATPPPYSWTGAYFGLHMGVDWANDPDSTVSFQRFTGAPPGVPHPLQSTALNSVPNGFGGVQFGYNWQGGGWNLRIKSPSASPQVRRENNPQI